MKRTFKQVCRTAAIFCVLPLLCGCGSGSAEKNVTTAEETETSIVTEVNGMRKIIADSSNVKQLGRTQLIDETLWLAFSGTGADFDYTGKKLDITLKGDGSSLLPKDGENCARVAIYVDGERVIDDMIDKPEEVYTVFESDESKTVNVKIVKLSETAMSTFGIKPIEIQPDETIVPAAEKSHRIEFVGDSITCGYGVDDEVAEHPFHTSTEDVTKAYAYKTAQALDADYSMVSISGYGIISGWTANPNNKVPNQTIPQYYTKLGFSYQKFASMTPPSSLEWDFSKFVPEVVVVNLGTNDDSYVQGNPEKQKEYSEAYAEFLKVIREKNPDAEIFCTLGIMGQRLFPGVEDAVKIYTESTGDTKIHTFMFDAQDGSLGYAADWHPTAATHDKASEALVAEIKSVMGW